MKLMRVLPYAKELLKHTVLPGEIVIDATAGNGNDTVFLAELVGSGGHVYAFDIQQKALESTANRLGELTANVSLILDSHDNVTKYIEREVGGAIFNLGYLPHSDDLSIVTKAETTISAIQQMLGLLKKGGLIAIAVYDGHEGGAIERDALLDFVKSLHQGDVQVIRYEQVNARNNPPFLIAIEKMRDFKKPRQVTIE